MPSFTGLRPIACSSLRPTSSAERTKSVSSTQPAPTMPFSPTPSPHSTVFTTSSVVTNSPFTMAMAVKASSRPSTRTASTSHSSSGAPMTADRPLMHSDPPLCWKISMIGSRSRRTSA